MVFAMAMNPRDKEMSLVWIESQKDVWSLRPYPSTTQKIPNGHLNLVRLYIYFQIHRPILILFISAGWWSEGCDIRASDTPIHLTYKCWYQARWTVRPCLI